MFLVFYTLHTVGYDVDGVGYVVNGVGYDAGVVLLLVPFFILPFGAPF